jgi:quinol-cytochrome oxidoreductase complex cytochrome b subunit
VTDVTPPKVRLAWRVTGWFLFVALMAVGFLGYLTPGMRLNWETIAAMCGF